MNDREPLAAGDAAGSGASAEGGSAKQATARGGPSKGGPGRSRPGKGPRQPRRRRIAGMTVRRFLANVVLPVIGIMPKPSKRGLFGDKRPSLIEQRVMKRLPVSGRGAA
mgnify:CR=1 FL=1